MERLQTQGDHGLLVEIDDTTTGDGVIVCTNGFRATTLTLDDFRKLASLCNAKADIYTIDDSSIVFEVYVARFD